MNLHPEVEGKVSITGPPGQSIHYVFMTSLCLHLLSYHHCCHPFLFLCYHCYIESAQANFSNDNFSPILNKDWSVYTQRLKEISFWMWFLPEIKHSPHAYPSMQHFPVSLKVPQTYNLWDCLEFLPLLKDLLILPLKMLTFDLHFHCCCPDSVLITIVPTLTLPVPPHSSPL